MRPTAPWEEEKVMNSETIITASRTYISQMLKRLPAIVKETGTETVIDLLCEEIKKLPIPFVATALS